jgi:DNA replication protein DnaC
MNPCKSKWQQKWLRLDVVAPEIQELATAAESFCSRWFNNSPGKTLLVIVGDYGSGKTHTAKAIFRFCLSAAMSAFDTKKWGEHRFPNSTFISWPEAANAFNEKHFGIMDEAMENDLVILDDVGAENDPWKICSDRLCQVLSRREKRFTVVTTNVSPINWEERFDGRINDRLLRNSVVVDISKVPSYSLRA